MWAAASGGRTELETSIGMILGLGFIAVLVATIVVGVRFSKKAIRKRQQFLADRGSKMMVALSHVDSLPIAEGSPCNLFLSEHKVSIENGGNVFNIGIEQISVADFKMDVEIAQLVKGNASKGVVGGILFGPVGAIIGSRAICT